MPIYDMDCLFSDLESMDINIKSNLLYIQSCRCLIASWCKILWLKITDMIEIAKKFSLWLWILNNLKWYIKCTADKVADEIMVQNITVKNTRGDSTCIELRFMTWILKIQLSHVMLRVFLKKVVHKTIDNFLFLLNFPPEYLFHFIQHCSHHWTGSYR